MKSGTKLEKVAESGEKLWKVGEKLWKVGEKVEKSSLKWGKLRKSGE